jgi:hypothetical protein
MGCSFSRCHTDMVAEVSDTSTPKDNGMMSKAAAVPEQDPVKKPVESTDEAMVSSSRFLERYLNSSHIVSRVTSRVIIPC